MYGGGAGYSSAYGGGGGMGGGGYSALPTAYGGGGGMGGYGGTPSSIPRSTSPRKPFKRGGSGGGGPSPAGVAFTRVLLVAALLACGGLFYSVTHHRGQHARLRDAHGHVQGELEVARAELYHARTALDSHRAAAAEAESHVETKVRQAAASERAAEAARATHLESKLTGVEKRVAEAEGRARELQRALDEEKKAHEKTADELAEARRLDEAYRSYLQEEVDAHRAREENWMHVQREWEEMERELTAELGDLRRQAKAAGLVFKAGGYLEGLGASAGAAAGAAAGGDQHHPHAALPKHVEAEAARAMPAEVAKDMAAAGHQDPAAAAAAAHQQQQQHQQPAAAATATATATPAVATATATNPPAAAAQQQHQQPAPAAHTHHDDAHGQPAAHAADEHHDGWLHGVGEWLHGGHHEAAAHEEGHGPPATDAAASGGGNAREMHRQQLEAEQELHHFYADYPGMPEHEAVKPPKRSPNKITGSGGGRAPSSRAAQKAAQKEAQRAAKALAAAQAAAQAQAHHHQQQHHDEPAGGHHHHVADDLSWKLGLMAGGGPPEHEAGGAADAHLW